MTRFNTKSIKPEYAKWRNRVEGQIRHAMNEHPEWFNLPTKEIQERATRSIAKRIIGEIVAGTAPGNSSDEERWNSDCLCLGQVLCNGQCDTADYLWKYYCG